MQKITVCGLAYKVENDVKKIFLAKRADTKKFLPGKFELIGGHVELTDANLKEALKREIIEELGAEIEIENIVGEFSYFNSDKTSQTIEVVYWIKFVDESQIKLNPDDHSEFVWVDKTELDSLITDKNDNEYILISDALKI